jgi:hypothetical protein
VGNTPYLLTKNNIPIYKYTDGAALAKVVEAVAKAAGK